MQWSNADEVAVRIDDKRNERQATGIDIRIDKMTESSNDVLLSEH